MVGKSCAMTGCERVPLQQQGAGYLRQTPPDACSPNRPSLCITIRPSVSVPLADNLIVDVLQSEQVGMVVPILVLESRHHITI